MKFLSKFMMVVGIILALVPFGIQFGGDAYTWIFRATWWTMSLLTFMSGVALMLWRDAVDGLNDLAREVGKEIGRQ